MIMEAKATLRQVRISPFKTRQVLSLIRGKKADQALITLRYTPKKAARIIEKALRSAIANAEHNYGMDVDKLYVVRAFADQGPSMKRWRPVSMGRVHGYRHRTSHITVVVAER
jgi:large subunit ribosomal protein L22